MLDSKNFKSKYDKDIIPISLPSSIVKVSLAEGNSVILNDHQYINRGGKLKVIGKNISGIIVEVTAFTKKDPYGNLYGWDVDSTGIIHHIYLK